MLNSANGGANGARESGPAPSEERLTQQRLAMVEQQLAQRGIRDERVLHAMRQVPRHLFIAQQYREHAYEDYPVPISAGQTISQPYIVAAMLQQLELQPHEVALEIGTGSGYQTALLAQIVRQVYSIERHAVLADEAAAVLRQLDYRNVSIRVGDGTQGWPEAAPFDAILVSAASPSIPPPLLDQLAEGGRMMIPVGSMQEQRLQLVRRIGGVPHVLDLEGCRFVPLIGREGFTEE